MGILRQSHKAILSQAQNLWDDGHQDEAVALLIGILPKLRPKGVATDALIIATLAVYSSDLGSPQMGLEYLSKVPLDDVRRLTDVHLICLSARCACRAASGDLEGARRDRDRIRASDPYHFSLVLADSALSGRGAASIGEVPEGPTTP